MVRSMTLVEWKRAMARLAAIRNFMVVTNRLDLLAKTENAVLSLERDRNPEAAAIKLGLIAEQLEPYSDLQDALVLLSIWLMDYTSVEGRLRSASTSEYLASEPFDSASMSGQ